MGQTRKSQTYLRLGPFALEAEVDEAAVEDVDQRMVLDVGREGELPVRFLDVPLLLELGRRLPIICTSGDGAVSVWRAHKAAGVSEDATSRGCTYFLRVDICNEPPCQHTRAPRGVKTQVWASGGR